jgi:hypothetical protein
MRPFFLLLLLLLPATALAGPFVEVGVGTVFGACDHGCIKDEPVGIVAVGYRIPKTGLSLEVEHRSSLVEKDYGQNLVSIRYRKEWGE